METGISIEANKSKKFEFYKVLYLFIIATVLIKGPVDFLWYTFFVNSTILKNKLIFMVYWVHVPTPPWLGLRPRPPPSYTTIIVAVSKKRIKLN